MDKQMDLLRHELEAAFDEVVGKLDRVHLKAEQQLQAFAILRDHVAEVSQAIQREVPPQAAPAEAVDLGPVTSRLAELARRVDEVRAALDARTNQEPDPGADAAKDLRVLAEGLDRLHQDVTANRLDLAKVAQILKAAAPEGSAPELTQIEEVVRRGMVANAADVANLRTDVETLTSVIRDQQTAMVEMRKQMEWIRQRLLDR